MAKQAVNLGTSPNKGDGDPIRTAMRKINENFDELYAGNFADPENTASNIIPSADGTYDLGSADKAWADLHVKDFIYIGGVRLEASGNTILIGGDVVAREDTVGSLFGDDSTLLVDGISNTINLDGTVAGDIIPNANEAYDIGSATNRFRDLYLSGSTIDLGGTTLSIVGGNLQIGGTDIKDVVTAAGVDFADLTNKPTTLSAFGITDAYTQAEVDAAIAAQQHLPQGDLQGSVFADDSTLLVDGVNGSIPYSVISDVQVTESDLLVDWAGIVGTQIQTNGLPINTFTSGALRIQDTLYFGLLGDLGGDSPNITFSGANNTHMLITSGYDAAHDESGSVYINADSRSSALPGVVSIGSSSDVSIGNTSAGSSTDVYGEVEFNNGSTIFQGGNSVTFNCDVTGAGFTFNQPAIPGDSTQFGFDADTIDFGDGKTIDMQNSTVLFSGTTFTDEPWISLADLKTEVAASVDFADFQSRIAAL